MGGGSGGGETGDPGAGFAGALGGVGARGASGGSGDGRRGRTLRVGAEGREGRVRAACGFDLFSWRRLASGRVAAAFARAPRPDASRTAPEPSSLAQLVPGEGNGTPNQCASRIHAATRTAAAALKRAASFVVSVGVMACGALHGPSEARAAGSNRACEPRRDQGEDFSAEIFLSLAPKFPRTRSP